MENKISSLLEVYPNSVKWTDLVDFISFDERRSAIDCLVTNTIGVSEGFIEFTPNNEPPLREEILCWILAIRPDLSNELVTLDISENFRVLLHSYINNNMEEFWNQIS